MELYQKSSKHLKIHQNIFLLYQLSSNMTFVENKYQVRTGLLETPSNRGRSVPRDSQLQLPLAAQPEIVSVVVPGSAVPGAAVPGAVVPGVVVSEKQTGFHHRGGILQATENRRYEPTLGYLSFSPGPLT